MLKKSGSLHQALKNRKTETNCEHDRHWDGWRRGNRRRAEGGPPHHQLLKLTKRFEFTNTLPCREVDYTCSTTVEANKKNWIHQQLILPRGDYICSPTSIAQYDKNPSNESPAGQTRSFIHWNPKQHLKFQGNSTFPELSADRCRRQR